MPPDSDALQQALQLQQRGDFAGAEKVYRRLLEADPGNFQLLNDHAACCLNLGAFAEAVTDLTRAATIAPDAALVHFNLAIALHMLGSMKRADESAMRAFALAPEREDMREMWQELKSQPFFGIAGGLQGAHAPARQVFMSAAVDLLKDSRHLEILEVGSYMGASLLTWANAVDKLHGGSARITCIDPWGLGDTAPQYGGDMATALATDQAQEIFLHNASLVRGRVEVEPIRDLSEHALRRLPDARYDIVYVDACHFYREALIDITEGRRLVKEGGILCGDDLELQPAECDLDNARRHARDDYVVDPRSGQHFHPGVTLAVHELFGRVSAFSGFWAMRKVNGGFAEVSFARARRSAAALAGGIHGANPRLLPYFSGARRAAWLNAGLCTAPELEYDESHAPCLAAFG